MAKKSSLDLFSLVAMGVGFVGAVLATIGASVGYINATTHMLGKKGESVASTLSEIAEANEGLGKLGEKLEMASPMMVLAYIVLALAALAAVAYIGSKLLGNDLLDKLACLLGALTVVATILLLVFALMYCSKNSAMISDGNGVKLTLAAGAIMQIIGGFLAGLVGVSTLKK